MTGIYKITSPSGKVYIGQSWNIKVRWNHYFNYDLRQRLLRHSFLKYSVNNHIFDVVCELPNDVHQKTLDIYEQLYMDFYRLAGLLLLNLKEAGSTGKLSVETKQKMSISRIGNKNTLGRKLTQEQKDNISIKLKDRIFSDDHRLKLKLNNQKTRTITQYSLAGLFIRNWESITHASIILKIVASSISRVCSKKLLSAGGFIWEYKNITP